MAQHDYSIANATGFNFRGDINNVLAAIVTQNSGSTAPSPAFPGMLWLDLSGGGNGIMRRRNQANDAWLNDIGVDQVARNAAAAAQAKADRAIIRDASATVAERTMALPVILPNTVPVQHEAVSRAQADLIYQVKLPTATANALLLGTAAGWLTVMPPGGAGSVLTISGGAVIWQGTATVATPNSVVRTVADGTIDPSFIPAASGGLKFCATFKPVVNDEYPTTGDGGHGTGGAPTMGDFWVIDGLSTGGYTYLTGSLSGVTVFNGDSVAYNGSGSWYKLSNTVSVSGYLKTDGSNAMVGGLNMGNRQIYNVSAITGADGLPATLSNFEIDPNCILMSPLRGTTGPDLAPMEPGQIGTDMGRMQLYVGTGGASNAGLIPVRYFSDSAAYAQNEHVVGASGIYRARNAVAAGAFTSSQWYRVMDEAGGTIDGNLNFSGLARRITGNFSASPVSDRTIFQTNVANGSSTVAVIPNGTGTASAFACFNGADPANAGSIQLRMDATVAVLGSAGAGSGALRPISVQFNSVEKVTISTNGDIMAMGSYIAGGTSAVLATTGAGTCLLRPNGFASTTGQLTLDSAGNCSAVNFSATSDARLKEKVTRRSARDRLADLLEFVSFVWTGEGGAPGLGLIAQQVQKVAPEYVHETPDGTLGIDKAALAIECVIGLAARARELEGRLP